MIVGYEILLFTVIIQGGSKVTLPEKKIEELCYDSSKRG